MQTDDLLPLTDEASTKDQDPQGRLRLTKRSWWTLGIVAAIVAVVTTLLLIPAGYVIFSPGPTINVLGSQGETLVLEFAQSGTTEDVELPVPREAQSDDGQLRMVTVSELGGPGSTVRGADLVRAWFNPATTVRKFSDIYDTEVTAEELEQASAAQMTSSHSTATIAAMDYLGVPMDSTLTIVGASPGSDAEGQVEDGDILVSLKGPDGVVHVVDRPSVPFAVMKTVEPGSTMEVVVLRDGEQKVISIVSSGPKDDEVFVGSKMGIYLDASTELPISVTIHLERIGGPSAGLIFALGIIDSFTEGGITGGQVIAGTGALSFAGDVLPIGGVKQKMYAAVRDGAKWFLVPKDNCGSVVGNEPSGLSVIPVSTLSQAVGVVESISEGATADLPVCEAP